MRKMIWIITWKYSRKCKQSCGGTSVKINKTKKAPRPIEVSLDMTAASREVGIQVMV